MNYFKSGFFLGIVILLFNSCQDGTSGSVSISERKILNKELNISEEIEETNAPIVQERIDGPANIRDTVNGKILFEFYDNVIVDATQFKNDWCEIQLFGEVSNSEADVGIVKKGKFIIQNGDTLGIVKTDYETFYTFNSNAKQLASFYGYTHKNNIKKESIIENKLNQNLKSGKRKISDWKNFSRTFQMDTSSNQFGGFYTLSNYENSIDDPSPGYRLVLLFEENQLNAILHTRKIDFQNGINYPIKNSTYELSFFGDYPINKRQRLVNEFEEFVVSVD